MAYSDAIRENSRRIPRNGTKGPDMSVLFDQFFENYLLGNLISWLDAKANLGFEKEFPLLKEFLSEAAKPNTESVASRSIWRLCHLKALKDRMDVPEEFNAAINDYSLPGNKYDREEVLHVYEKLRTYGGHKGCTWLKRKGSCWSMQRRHRALQQN
ncbi:hypothetical protein DPV78_011276 [Talaromyces pinophilus]|nr:hypothetical protein DPV78_011276 [Talaromyces pinophilus]